MADRLPPILPPTKELLDRAIVLLGNRTKSELRKKARDELEALIGAYPPARQAAVWKQSLLRVRRGSPP